MVSSSNSSSYNRHNSRITHRHRSSHLQATHTHLPTCLNNSNSSSSSSSSSSSRLICHRRRLNQHLRAVEAGSAIVAVQEAVEVVIGARVEGALINHLHNAVTNLTPFYKSDVGTSKKLNRYLNI
jgi:hypothetical protein